MAPLPTRGHNMDGLRKGGLMRGVLRMLRRVALVLLVAVALTCVAVAWRGYELYRNAVSARPVEETVEAIRSQPGYVSLDELPQTYLDAVVAVEDHRFWGHPGVDVIAIGRAAAHDVMTLSLEQGGSTITQQLAKNLFLTQDKDLARKAAEVFLALDIEGRYEKREILELYVNTAYFGRGCYGIGEAARELLGKEPSEMTPDECALMAGIPNAPSALSADAGAAERRRRVVVGQMEKYGYDVSALSADSG